jgi:hypothetical protein
LHYTHVPEHAVPQQTPWAQKPELHMSFEVHGDWIGSLPQLMLTQLLGEEQSALLAHGIILQVGVVVLQTYGSHSVLVTERQTPAPSQVR